MWRAECLPAGNLVSSSHFLEEPKSWLTNGTGMSQWFFKGLTYMLLGSSGIRLLVLLYRTPFVAVHARLASWGHFGKLGGRGLGAPLYMIISWYIYIYIYDIILYHVILCYNQTNKQINKSIYIYVCIHKRQAYDVEAEIVIVVSMGPMFTYEASWKRRNFRNLLQLSEWSI